MTVLEKHTDKTSAGPGFAARQTRSAWQALHPFTSRGTHPMRGLRAPRLTYPNIIDRYNEFTSLQLRFTPPPSRW
jgi:hypothetical protein